MCCIVCMFGNWKLCVCVCVCVCVHLFSSLQHTWDRIHLKKRWLKQQGFEPTIFYLWVRNITVSANSFQIYKFIYSLSCVFNLKIALWPPCFKMVVFKFSFNWKERVGRRIENGGKRHLKFIVSTYYESAALVAIFKMAKITNSYFKLG